MVTILKVLVTQGLVIALVQHTFKGYRLLFILLLIVLQAGSHKGQPRLIYKSPRCTTSIAENWADAYGCPGRHVGQPSRRLAADRWSTCDVNLSNSKHLWTQDMGRI